MRLIKLSHKYKKQFIDMMDEWIIYNEKIVPWAIRRTSYHNWDDYIESLENGFLPIKESTYFLYDEVLDIILGAINIRHSLDDKLLLNGGHIGYGIRPTQRRKGHGVMILKLGLVACKKIGLERVLVVCHKENVGSARTIEKCGGILENSIVIDGIVEQRYWIQIR